MGVCDRSHMNHSIVGITILPTVINFSLLVSYQAGLGTYRYGSASNSLLSTDMPIFSSYGIPVGYTDSTIGTIEYLYRTALRSGWRITSIQFNSFGQFVVPVYLPMRQIRSDIVNQRGIARDSEAEWM
jgi:hypothetical protein